MIHSAPMIRYQILGQSNYAISILLDAVRQLHSGAITAEIVSNIAPEDNPSRAYAYGVEGVETTEVPHSDWRRDPDSRLLIGSIGQGRRRIFEFFRERFGIEAADYENVVHPRAILPLSVEMGHGGHISPGAIIAPHAKLGDFVVVNRNASVGHHTTLQDFVTVNPGANVAGVCALSSGVTIGAGATVVDRVHIGADSFIGAGSLVTKNIGAGVVAYGVPAKAVRVRES